MPRSAVSLARLLPAPDPVPADAPLLRTFEATRSDDAFEELVRRHGPMVLATCRRALCNPDDAEDAFQAVFLVLARKANTVRGNLAGWLYAVAVRTARGVRIMRERRRKHETRASARSGSVVLPESDHDLAAVIDEELARLPGHYREAVVLCELRGLSRKQAASELGIPEGTLSGRLAVARRKLAALLSARGLAPAAMIALLAPASVSARLVESSVLAVRGTVGAVASAAASAVVKAMLFDQLKTAALAAGILLTVVCGGFAMTGSGRGEQPARAPRLVDDPAAKLVEQLGAPEFADREDAAKKLRELGMIAEPALRTGLRSENPEVRNRAANVLAAIRADAREAFVMSFDPAGTAEYDHPVWKRFKTVVGSDAPARKLFAEIIADPRSFRLLDDAERDPEHAGNLYAAEVDRVYDAIQNNLTLTGTPSPNVVPWPAPSALSAVVYLGTYPSSTGKVRDGWARECYVFMAEQDGRWDKAPSAPALKRVFAAWLARRDDPLTLGRGFGIAVYHGINDVLPYARTVAADKTHPVEVRVSALPVIAQFGTPTDRPLFAAFFDSLELFASQESSVPPGATPPPPLVTEARDYAIGHALLLYDQDPFEFGFTNAENRFRRENGRAVVARFDEFHLGFRDEKARTAAHAKAKAFLDKQPKTEPKNEEPKPDPVSVKLVEQLGAAEFADREAAEKTLKELGVKAKPAVLAGLKSESPEVVRRCRAVFDHLRGEEVKTAFLKTAGDDEPARALLAEVLKDAHRARVLDEAVQHPERSGKLYAAEQWRLWQKAVSTPPGAKEADIPTAPEIALSFLLGSHPSSADSLKTEPPPNDSRISEGRRAVETDLLCKSLQLELMDPKRRGPFARLMAAWMATRSDPWVVGLGLSQARQYRLPEVVPVARQVVRDAKLDAQHRAAATLALADLGGMAELPTLRSLMDDKTEWSRSREGRNPDSPTLIVELRDVAVGAVLLLSGQDPGEFGFPEFRRQGVAELKTHEKLNGRWFAFTTDADRAAAHKKAKEWLDTQEKKDAPKK